MKFFIALVTSKHIPFRGSISMTNITKTVNLQLHNINQLHYKFFFDYLDEIQMIYSFG